MVAAWEKDVDGFPRSLATTFSRLLLIALGGLVAITTLVLFADGITPLGLTGWTTSR